jgi:hypothetical protein
VQPYAADSGNTYDIVSELSEYVTDVDAAISRESVRAVGRVALDGDQDVSGIVDRLLQFLDHGEGLYKLKGLYTLNSAGTHSFKAPDFII